MTRRGHRRKSTSGSRIIPDETSPSIESSQPPTKKQKLTESVEITTSPTAEPSSTPNPSSANLPSETQEEIIPNSHPPPKTAKFEQQRNDYPPVRIAQNAEHKKSFVLHSKEPPVHPVSNLEIPSWATSSQRIVPPNPFVVRLAVLMCIVPSLPIVADLSLLLVLVEPFYMYDSEAAGRNNSKSARRHKRFRSYFTEQFRSSTFLGDKHLHIFGYRAALDLLGRDNCQLAFRVSEKWSTNENMKLLAQCYQLDRLVGVHPKPGMETNIYLSTESLFLADLWEAWWGVAIEERIRWGRSDEDLGRIVKRLMILQFEELISQYSTRNFGIKAAPPFPKNATITYRAITFSDELITRHLSGLAEGDKYGYVATVMDDTRTMTLFARTQEAAKLRLEQYLMCGETASEVDFETIIDHYDETEYRHTIFTAAYHVLHGTTLPTTPEVLQDLLNRLQGVSRFFGRDKTRNFRDQDHLEIFAESYWNEANLEYRIHGELTAQAITDLIALICHASLNLPSRKKLLSDAVFLFESIVRSNRSSHQQSQSPSTASISFRMFLPFPCETTRGKIYLNDGILSEWGPSAEMLSPEIELQLFAEVQINETLVFVKQGNLRRSATRSIPASLVWWDAFQYLKYLVRVNSIKKASQTCQSKK